MSEAPEGLERLISNFDRLTAERDALRAALEPFGELANEGNEDQPADTKVVVQAGRSTCYGLTLADLRRARAAIRSRATTEGPK